MDFQKNMVALKLIEQLLSDGHNLGNLPIPRDRAVAIAEMQEDATDIDLQALLYATGDGGAC
jgi:hypothetical protein